MNTKYFEKVNAISFILHTPMTNGEILVLRKLSGINGNRILFIRNNGEMKRIGGADKKAKADIRKVFYSKLIYICVREYRKTGNITRMRFIYDTDKSISDVGKVK